MTNSSLNVTHSKRRSAWDIAVSNDGLKFYILDNLTLKVYQYASSQSNDISGLPTDAGRLKLWASLYDATLDFSGVANATGTVTIKRNERKTNSAVKAVIIYTL